MSSSDASVSRCSFSQERVNFMVRLHPPLAGEGWGGGICKRNSDCFQHALPIRHHVIIVETKHAKAPRNKKRITTRVALHGFLFKMLSAIEFDYQVRGVAYEIRNIKTNRRLPPEASTIHA